MVFCRWWGRWLYRCCFACNIFQVTLVPSVGQDSARTCRLICKPVHFHLISLLPLKSMPSCRIPGPADGSTPSSQTSLSTLPLQWCTLILPVSKSSLVLTFLLGTHLVCLVDGVTAATIPLDVCFSSRVQILWSTLSAACRKKTGRWTLVYQSPRIPLCFD